MDIIWDGITKSKTLNPEVAEIKHALANTARSFDWNQTIKILSQNPELINSSRPDGNSLYAPLHQAAYGGASVEIVKQMIKLGAWCTLQNARGERPLDVAEVRNHEHLIPVLRPRYKHHVPLGVLLKIQQNFHDVIRGRVEELVEEHNLRLPELKPLLELKRPHMYFAVPGMYGGFSYALEVQGVNAKLVASSWCRVAGGSGQRHVTKTVSDTKL